MVCVGLTYDRCSVEKAQRGSDLKSEREKRVREEKDSASFHYSMEETARAHGPTAHRKVGSAARFLFPAGERAPAAPLRNVIAGSGSWMLPGINAMLLYNSKTYPRVS